MSCATAQTISTPKLTIASAITCVSAGDTILVRAGTYAEYIQDFLYTIPSGTAGNPITLKAYPNEAVTISPPTENNSTGLIDFAGNDYWTVSGFILDGLNQVGALIRTGITATNIRLENNEIKNGGWNGVQWGSTNGEIVGNNIHDNAQVVPPPGNQGYGIYLSSDGTLVEGNNIHHNSGYGMQVYGNFGGNRNNIIRNNIFHENGTRECALGFLVGGSDQLVYNNIVYAESGGGIQVNLTGPINVKVFNNTIYNVGNSCGDLLAGIYVGADAIGTTVRNNITFASASSNAVVNLGSGSTLSNNTTVDPGFVNAPGADFHLLDTSSILGDGVAVAEVTVDKDGVARPDPQTPGAYELSGSDPLDDLLENFDAYSTSASINTLNGGTGWSGAWSLASGTVTVETAPAWMSGKSLRQNATAYAEAARLFTAHTGTATLSFKTSLSATPNDYVIVALLDGSGNNVIHIAFDGSGNLITNTQTLISGFTVNTAHSVDVEIDTISQAGKFRARVNGGSFLSWENAFSAFTSIAGIRFYSYATNAHTFWLDDISDVAAGFITNVNPNTGQQGTAPSVTLTGSSTSWVTSTSVLTFSGAGVTSGATTCASATSCSATVTITSGAATGARNVIMTTGADVETATNAFTVTGGFITNINPSFGIVGTSFLLTVTGSNTNWVTSTTVLSFSGEGVTAGATTCSSGTSCTATVTVAAEAVNESRNVTMTTGADVVSTLDTFVILPASSSRMRLRVR